MASLTGSFALARERPPGRHPVPLGGKLGGKIVKQRGRRAVAASGRPGLWSHRAGQVLASPGGGRGPHSIAPARGQQFAPHRRSVRRVPAMSSGCLRRRKMDRPTRKTGTMADSVTTPLTASPAVSAVNQDDDSRMLLRFLQYQRDSVLKIVEGLPEDAWQTPGVASGWTVAGMLAHLGGVEHHWLQHVTTGVMEEPPAAEDAGGGAGGTDEPGAA